LKTSTTASRRTTTTTPARHAASADAENSFLGLIMYLDHMNINSQCDWMKDMVWTNFRFSLLMYRLIKQFSFKKMSMVFQYKTLIANILVRTPVCKPTTSPGSQGKMCRAGFVQLLITNVLDRTSVCKVRAMVFPLKSRENSQCRICAYLQRKWFRLNTVCKARLRR
jgi:hypothetical protein